MITMPFKRNDVKTKEWARKGARKGYFLEQKQLNEMRNALSRDIAMVKKLQQDKDIDLIMKQKLEILQSRIKIYSDKLHATKESHEHSGEIMLPMPILGGITKKNDTRSCKET